MSRPLYNNNIGQQQQQQGQRNKLPNYAQAASNTTTMTTRPPLPQQTNDLSSSPQGVRPNLASSRYQGGHGGGYYNNNNKNSYNNKSNYNKKPPVQLPMASPAGTDTAQIQFGSINQNSNAPVQQQQQQQGIRGNHDIVARGSEVQQFGSVPVTDTSTYHHHYHNNNSNHNHHYTNNRPQMRPPATTGQQEIPRSPRTTTNNNSDNRLFTQPYVPPRQNYNQGDYHQNNNRYNNNSSNNYNNRHNNNNNGSNSSTYRPPQQPQPQQPLPPSSNTTAATTSPLIQQQQQHSPHQSSPSASSPINIHRSPYVKKNSLSPHIPNSPQQNIQMTASWSPGPQYYYPQYPVQVPAYMQPTTRSPTIIPPPAPRKVIAIVDPNTGTALNTNPMSLNSSNSPSIVIKEPEKLDFKVPVPHVSKAVSIVDPAIRDRELREKKEREEAEKEAQRLKEEEDLRKQKEEEERLKKEEEERIKREQEEQEAIKKAEQEAELLRKAEEEKEAKRVIAELEAKKRREEQERIISEAKQQQKPATVKPNSLDLSAIPPFNATKKTTSITTLIEDSSTINYPPGIQAPVNQANDDKLTYSIEFLLQFQQLCLETDDDVLSTITKEMGDMRAPTTPTARQYSNSGKSPRTPGHQNANHDPMLRMSSRDNNNNNPRMEMGKFNMGRPLASRMNSTNTPNMERQASRGGMRGGRGGMKVIRNPPQQHGAPTIPFEQVAPLEKSENRWVPATQAATSTVTVEGEGGEELMTQEFITRKVNALLNKLTLERFDSIMQQIFEYAKQSAKEQDGKSLRTVMKLTFEKACDEPAFASMWARLCRAMYDSMTDDIKDVSILNEQKEPSSGVLLFRKYLFNRCQVEFEKGWKVNMPKVTDDEMMTEEYYVAVKAKRQGLGLIQFIGELFKLEMLSERIMYSCMIKLCNDPSNAGDEEAESLCKLLITIGKALDSKPKTQKWVDIVIGRMKNEMINSPNLTSRTKFMIQDLLDLRKEKWIPRHGGKVVAPTTIAKIHEMAEKQKEEAAAALIKRTNSRPNQPYIPNNQYNINSNNAGNMNRNNSSRGGNNNTYSNNNNGNNNAGGGANDGWSTVASPAATTPSSNTKARNNNNNDMSNFGKLDRSRSKSNILGPSNSAFPSSFSKKQPSITDSKSTNDNRSSSPASNMFSVLNTGEPERKKIHLAPRTVQTPAEEDAPTEKLSDEVVRRKSKNILEEYFSIRDKNELVECVKELNDPDYLVVFILEMLTVVEKKVDDIEMMKEVIKFFSSEGLLTEELYIKAFKQFMEGYDDLTIDVPQAPKYVAQLLVACSLTPEQVDDEGFGSLTNAYQKALAEEQA